MSLTTKAFVMAMQTLTFQAQEPKIERTHSITGKVTAVQSYSTKTNIPGAQIMLDNCPYSLRVLMGSVKGAFTPQELLNCTVTLTGIMREHDGKQYFNPKDLTVDRVSGLAQLVKSGVAYAGSLD
jgi:hypothetical protein